MLTTTYLGVMTLSLPIYLLLARLNNSPFAVGRIPYSLLGLWFFSLNEQTHSGWLNTSFLSSLLRFLNGNNDDTVARKVVLFFQVLLILPLALGAPQRTSLDGQLNDQIREYYANGNSLVNALFTYDYQPIFDGGILKKWFDKRQQLLIFSLILNT